MEWITPQNIFGLIGTVLATLTGKSLVEGYFNRNKTKAEANNLNISGESQLSGEWQKLYLEIKKDKEDLRKEFALQIQEIRQAHAKEIESKDKKIEKLEGRILTLEDELKKYQNIENKVDNAADKLHSAVELAKEEIKTPKQD